MSAKSFKTKLGSGFVELPFDAKKEFGKARHGVRSRAERGSVAHNPPR